MPRPLRPALALLLRRHRAFDRRAARRVDRYVANGEITRERIRRFWGRDAEIVHPPVDVDRFAIGEPGEHVLFVGELVRHKRARAGDRGGGGGGAPDQGRRRRARARAPARPLRPRGRVPGPGRGRRELAALYAAAAALVVPNVEEFGIAAVEAQAAGRPVVAVDAGGARETVVPGRTGLLVPRRRSAARSRAPCART